MDDRGPREEMNTPFRASERGEYNGVRNGGTAGGGMRRREFISRAAEITALPFIAAVNSCVPGKDTPGLRYLASLEKVFLRIKKEEQDELRDIANLCAKAVLSRNLCFLATAQPGEPGYLSEDSPGLPRIFVYIRSREMADTIRSGDIVLADAPGEFVRVARVNGAKIAGICMPCVPDCANESQKKQYISREGYGDDVRPVMRALLPFGDGLVNIPEANFGILPGSGPVELALMTALAGEVYRRSERSVRIEHLRPRDAIEYLGTVAHRTRMLGEQADAVRSAAETIAKKLINRGTLWVYDRRGGLAREIAGGAGVPAFLRVIGPRQITDGSLRPIDALIFASLESNQPEDLHLIRMARGVTNAIVTLCPREQGGGYRIYNEAPASLDNKSPEKDGIRSFDNNTRTFLHTGGVLNGALFWALVGEVVGKIIAAGRVPGFFMARHLAGSVEYNDELRAKVEKGGW